LAIEAMSSMVTPNPPFLSQATDANDSKTHFAAIGCAKARKNSKNGKGDGPADTRWRFGIEGAGYSAMSA
jgi:hypothetical protein